MKNCNHQLGFSIYAPGYDSDYDLEFLYLDEKVKNKNASSNIEFDFCPKCGTRLLDESRKLMLEVLK